MREITNTTGLPLPIFEAVKRFNGKYNRGDDVDISVTQLSKPPRMVALEELHKHEMSVDAADLLWVLDGQIVHEILADMVFMEAYGLESERRYFTTVNGWKLSGQVDLFDIATGTLSDYKRCSAYEFKKGKPKDEWVEQINAYAELMRRNDREVKRLTAVRLFRDWSKQEARRDPDYPQKAWSEIEIPDWGREKASSWLLGAVERHQMARERLPECSQEERWNDGDVYAVMKNGNAKATQLYKESLLGNRAKTEAENHVNAMISGAYRVEHRRGESKRCALYCDVADFCAQRKDELARQNGT